VLLAHPDLVQILEASWRAVSPEKAETTSFRTPDGWQNEPTVRCPDCSAAMEKYGYMGIGAIQIDRCDRCDLVWLDTDELQNMVLALAKSNSRSEQDFQRLVRERIDVTPVAMRQVAPFGKQWLFADSDGSQIGLVLAQTLLQLILR
jgi:Zn-finger nucleic acid-binding protein